MFLALFETEAVRLARSPYFERTGVVYCLFAFSAASFIIVIPLHLTESAGAFQPPLASGKAPPAAGIHRAMYPKRFRGVLSAQASPPGAAKARPDSRPSPDSTSPPWHAAPEDPARPESSGEGVWPRAESRLRPCAAAACSWPRE